MATWRTVSSDPTLGMKKTYQVFEVSDVMQETQHSWLVVCLFHISILVEFFMLNILKVY